jgi:prevent-host-death family protein
MHEAKTHLSQLVEEVNHSGISFIIAKAGKPKVIVKPYDSEFQTEKSPVGFMPELKLPSGWEEKLKSEDNEFIELFYADNLFPTRNNI